MNHKPFVIKVITASIFHHTSSSVEEGFVFIQGHKSYVPNMISGASQADVGVLVISARKGEFETGFERGGQTREHAMLAKTLGICKLFVVVNKMDDPSVEWAKERFDEIEKKISPFLKSCGYNVKKDVLFLPISALHGTNIKDKIPKNVCGWWNGPTLFEGLDSIELPPRDPKGPFRMPLIDRFKDMVTVVMRKTESGTVRQGDSLTIMPNKVHVKVVAIELALNKILSASEGSGVDQNAFIADSNAKLNEIGPTNQLGGSQKELNVALSKYGKIVDKQLYPDMAKAYREVEFDRDIINMIIALHFYRQGLFELGDCFISEANESGAASLKAPFVEMYEMLEQMKARNLQPALAWASAHSDELLQKGSSLEFKLHALQYMQILERGIQRDALTFARSSFAPFAPLHMEEIQKLMGCLLWTGRLENSPYSELLSSSHWDALSLELTQECCSLLGQSYKSPLHVTISAGCQALPTLLKLSNVMANKKHEWQTMRQLPVEIELDKEFQFHSIFVCPGLS